MKKIAAVLILIIILPVKCYAISPVEELYEQFNLNYLIEELPYQTTETAKEILSYEIDFKQLISLTPQQLLNVIVGLGKKYVFQYREELFSVISAVLILIVIGSVWELGSNNELYDIICVLSITVIMLQPILNCISDSCNAIKDITRFMTAYVPVYTSVITASGTVTAAVFYQTVVFAAIQIINELSVSIILPLLHGYILLFLSGSISKNDGILGLCEGLKKLVVWTLILLSSIFTAILSFQSIYGSAADSVFSKTTKFLVGSFVPIIGSAFSDALSAVNGSLKVIRAAVGGFGIAAVFIGFLPVLANITILRVIIWFAKMISDTLSVTRVKYLFTGFSNTLSIMTALIISTIGLFIVSTAIMMTIAVT